MKEKKPMARWKIWLCEEGIYLAIIGCGVIITVINGIQVTETDTIEILLLAFFIAVEVLAAHIIHYIFEIAVKPKIVRSDNHTDELLYYCVLIQCLFWMIFGFDYIFTKIMRFSFSFIMLIASGFSMSFIHVFIVLKLEGKGYKLMDDDDDGEDLFI